LFKKKKVLILLVVLVIILAGYLSYVYIFNTGSSSRGPSQQEEVAYDSNKDLSIQEINLAERKKMAKTRFPGDTLDLMEYVIRNYPKGTYLIDDDRTTSYNTPQSAVIYTRENGGTYIYAIIAKSRQSDDRLIEQKNVIGYDASFIDLDSTKLGTALFYLSLFKYENSSFQLIWETPVPTHGGFNRMTLENWAAQHMQYIRINFHDARSSGHVDYNYFLVNGMFNKPMPMETYEGINCKRTLVDFNKDKYPDWCEYLFVDSGTSSTPIDSVFFEFRQKDSVFVNTRNKRQMRKYNELGQECSVK
jgi:hypothetical protein